MSEQYFPPEPGVPGRACADWLGAPFVRNAIIGVILFKCGESSGFETSPTQSWRRRAR